MVSVSAGAAQATGTEVVAVTDQSASVTPGAATASGRDVQTLSGIVASVEPGSAQASGNAVTVASDVTEVVEAGTSVASGNAVSTVVRAAVDPGGAQATGVDIQSDEADLPGTGTAAASGTDVSASVKVMVAPGWAGSGGRTVGVSVTASVTPGAGEAAMVRIAPRITIVSGPDDSVLDLDADDPGVTFAWTTDHALERFQIMVPPDPTSPVEQAAQIGTVYGSTRVVEQARIQAGEIVTSFVATRDLDAVIPGATDVDAIIRIYGRTPQGVWALK
jgi:hypothetical protein